MPGELTGILTCILSRSLGKTCFLFVCLTHITHDLSITSSLRAGSPTEHHIFFLAFIPSESPTEQGQATVSSGCPEQQLLFPRPSLSSHPCTA